MTRITPRLRTATLLAALSLATITAVAGCASHDAGDSAAGDSGAASQVDAGRDAAEVPAAQDADGLTSYSVADSSTGKAANRAPADPEIAQALIKKGNVELRADDVGKAKFDVQKAVDRHDGQVSEEETTTDDDGDPAYTRMVLRVPSSDFDATMADLTGLGTADLVSANASEEDVTTKLIDTRTRLAAQRRSVARITELFDRAQSIREIMAIEAQLSRRQAALDSLERRVAYLSNQTTLSTITVSIDKTPEKTAAVVEDDDSGFVAGLKAGWSGLSTFAVGLATVAGALLPWLIVVAILGPPALLLVRRVRRRISVRRSPA